MIENSKLAPRRCRREFIDIHTCGSERRCGSVDGRGYGEEGHEVCATRAGKWAASAPSFGGFSVEIAEFPPFCDARRRQL
jgi:hypothetical protein